MGVLDVGCGPGTITADLAGLVYPGTVVAVDNAEAILDTARSTMVDREVPNVEVKNADVYRLPFSDAHFDVVHAHQVLQHLVDPIAALREMRRVCKSGGMVAARDGDYPAMTWFPADPLLDRWMEIYTAVARSNRTEPSAGRMLLKWARAAGFSVVEPSASVWCFATPEERSWWGDLWAERIVASAVADQAVEIGVATRQELMAVSNAWRRWALDADGWYAIVNAEIICTP